MRTIAFKDSSRVYWELSYYPMEVNEEGHTIWGYELKNKDYGNSVAIKGRIVGVDDLEPTKSDFCYDINAYFFTVTTALLQSKG